MDLDKLRLFLAVAENQHFNRAADQVHVSPSKLSRIIQQLEAEIGTRLFDRDNRSVALTPKGQEFLAYSRELLTQWETAKGAMQTHSDLLTGSISLYCSVTASYSFLYDVLQNFRISQPHIEIKLHTGDPAAAIERIRAGIDDAAIAARPDRLPASLSFKSITRSPLKLIAPLKGYLPGEKGLARKPDESWRQIPFILSERGLARERINEWFAQQPFTANIYAQTSGHEAIVSMVSLGFGVGLVPQIVLENSPLADKARLFEYQPELAPYDLGICLQEKRLKNPIVKAFWEQL